MVFLREILFLLKSIWTKILNVLVHKDFHEAIAKMTLLDTLLFLVVHYIDRFGVWHRMPVILGLIYLATRRHIHQQYNLINVGIHPVNVRNNPEDYPYRKQDGSYNDPFQGAGGYKTFFGRNMLPSTQNDKLLKPDPIVVATKLLARRNYKDTGKQFNIVASSWIQFMIHDWVDHLEETSQMNELTAPESVASQCPLRSFKFLKTKEVSTGFFGIPKGHLNIRTSWWDASVVYGSYKERQDRVRSYQDGKLKIAENGLLARDDDGIAICGDVRNSWVGVSTLQALFIKEHNAVCDAIKAEDPSLSDEDLYRYGRLVVSAVIAKVHTIDWTVELLKTDTMLAGMRANWYGLLGKEFKDQYGHVGGAILGGLVGMRKPVNYGVPYSLTEEFVGVYRMHSLLPDSLQYRDISASPGPNKQPPLLQEVPMKDLIGHKGEMALDKIGFEKQMVSMGHQACGALELWNYPIWLRDLVVHDEDAKERPHNVDLAALEVYRDRERNVARYNEFRRGLLLLPIEKWEDLTDDKEAVEVLKEVYGDDNVEDLDLLVGLMAEKKIKGFAISETAFVIFLLMATRRLEADKFFTSHYNAETYTKTGLAWVNSTESLKDVIDRHYPGLTQKWMNCESAFSVWDSPPKPRNTTPLYFRIPN